eukprot:231804_1
MSDKTSQIPKVNPPKKQIQHSIPAIPSKSKFVAVRCPSYYVQDVRHYPLITKLQQAVQNSGVKRLSSFYNTKFKKHMIRTPPSRSISWPRNTPTLKTITIIKSINLNMITL